LKIGLKICRHPEYERYAVGNASARLREPERRKVGVDARVSVAGVNYEVDPELAGETVILWRGIFDNELFVEHGDKRFGPYSPVGGPIPLYRYRTFKKSPTQQRADRIEALARPIGLTLGRTGRQSPCSFAYP
jgi:hypothetical protein